MIDTRAGIADLVVAGEDTAHIVVVRTGALTDIQIQVFKHDHPIVPILQRPQTKTQFSTVADAAVVLHRSPVVGHYAVGVIQKQHALCTAGLREYLRSEERRVGKEWRSRWAPDQLQKRETQ